MNIRTRLLLSLLLAGVSTLTFATESTPSCTNNIPGYLFPRHSLESPETKNAKDLYDASKRYQMPCLDTAESLEGEDRDGDGIRDDVGLFISFNFEGRLASSLRAYALATRRALTGKICKGVDTPSGCLSLRDATMCVFTWGGSAPEAMFALSALRAVINNTDKRRAFERNINFWEKALAPSQMDVCNPIPLAR